jgi:hypothetical protein
VLAGPWSRRAVSNAYGNLIYSDDMPTPSAQDSKAYYDAFSKQYERIRGENAPLGYHELLDQLEAEFVAR